MTTTQDLIKQARVYLDGKLRPGRNKLLNLIDDTTGTLSFVYDIGGAAQGVQLAIGLETMYVWAASGKTMTVERGADGTTASQHAAGDVILIDPEFTDAKILDAINLELAALPSEGVYQVKTLDRTYNCQTIGYDLAADCVDVLGVSWQDQCDTTRWSEITSFEVQRDMPNTVFASGTGLRIVEQLFDGAALRIRYRTTFTALSTLDDDVVTTTGVPVSAVDILPLGAAITLMAGRPIQRVGTLAQPDPRDAAEVTVSAVLNAPAALRQRRQARVADEAGKLSREHVYRMPTRTLNPTGYRRPLRRWWP